MRTTSSTIKTLFLTGGMLINTITWVLIITSLSFFAGQGIASWQFPLSFIVSGVSCFYFSKQLYGDYAAAGRAVAISLVIIVVSVCIALCFFDVSYDGQSYHQEGIFQLRNGWNPFKQLLSRDVNMAIYINHYARGVEIPQSALYSLLGRIEVTKSTNFMLLAASFCLTLGLLLSLNRLSEYKAVLIAALITLNPIAVNQLISTYVDGQLAILLLCFFVTAIWIIIDTSLYNLLLLGAVIIVAANVKFTGLVYVVIFTAALLAWLLFVKNYVLLKKTVYLSLLAGFTAVVVVGYNPYVTNTVQFAHPFYPLMGKNKVDIMGYNTPKGFEDKNGFSRFFISLFAHTDNVMPNNGRIVTLKVPFTVNKSDIASASKIDTRIAGFGPFFSGILLLSAVMLAILLFRKQLRWTAIKNLVYLMGVLCFSIVIMPESWWARYIPQLWYLPLIVLLCAELYAKGQLKGLKIVTYGFLLLGVALTFIVFGWNLMMTSLVNYQLARLKGSKQTITVQWGSASSNRVRFQENNIRYVERNLDRVPNTENIIRSDSKFIVPNDLPNLPKSKLIQWAEKFQQVTEK